MPIMPIHFSVSHRCTFYSVCCHGDPLFVMSVCGLATICRSPNARKKLAVPFRAAHTPSERSEFAQPDVALLLTHLSYYADGLNLEQFTEGLEELQRMGKNAQHDYYSSWLALLSKQNIPAGTV